MTHRRITDPFDPQFPDWYMCDLHDMQRMFGSAGFNGNRKPESAPCPWIFPVDGRKFWQLCWVRKWVCDCGGVEAARRER